MRALTTRQKDSNSTAWLRRDSATLGRLTTVFVRKKNWRSGERKPLKRAVRPGTKATAGGLIERKRCSGRRLANLPRYGLQYLKLAVRHLTTLCSAKLILLIASSRTLFCCARMEVRRIT